MPNSSQLLPDDVWVGQQAKQISSGAVACKVGDKILIVKAKYKAYWTMPGGVVDVEETPIMAAIRELREETGLTVKVQELSFSHVLVANKCDLKVYNFVFETEIQQSAVDNLKLQESEIEDSKLVTKAQILSGEAGIMSDQLIIWAKGGSGYYESERK